MPLTTSGAVNFNRKIHSYCGEICLLDTGRRAPGPGNIRVLSPERLHVLVENAACGGYPYQH